TVGIADFGGGGRGLGGGGIGQARRLHGGAAGGQGVFHGRRAEAVVGQDGRGRQRGGQGQEQGASFHAVSPWVSSAPVGRGGGGRGGAAASQGSSRKKLGAGCHHGVEMKRYVHRAGLRCDGATNKL